MLTTSHDPFLLVFVAYQDCNHMVTVMTSCSQCSIIGLRLARRHELATLVCIRIVGPGTRRPNEMTATVLRRDNPQNTVQIKSS